MKQIKIYICIIMIISMAGCSTASIPEPERCSMCADISRHAICIINLSTGEKEELDIYEPHPFLVGEIAEEQPGGYFSFIRSAGIDGYKVGAEYIAISIPIKSEKLKMHHFCNFCRNLLANEKKSGYILVDLINPQEPVVYSINAETSFSIRDYSVTVQENVDDQEYQITITGHYEN